MQASNHHKPTLRWAAAAMALAVSAGAGAEPADYITVASTTSTEASGLFEAILPEFEAEHGIEVRVVAVGTGAALKYGQRCDADVVMVHAPAAEQVFVDAGYGVERHHLMYNDFVLIGPAADPAGIGDEADVAAAFAAIAEAESPFVSRGDDSGTHKKELTLWEAAGVDVAAAGAWYRETGSGMGEALNTARGMEAYILADRGTWISFGNRAGLEVLVEGDERLFNPYGVIMVDPEHCASVKQAAAQTFIDWLLSEDGQAAIGAYRLQGQQLFTPDAR